MSPALPILLHADFTARGGDLYELRAPGTIQKLPCIFPTISWTVILLSQPHGRMESHAPASELILSLTASPLAYSLAFSLQPRALLPLVQQFGHSLVLGCQPRISSLASC